MTTIIIKKRKKLSLPSSVNSTKKAKTPTPQQKAKKESKKAKVKVDPDVLKAKHRALRIELNTMCREWLMASFPTLFNPNDPKPLAVGIHHDIVQRHHEQGGRDVLGFGAHKPLRRVLTEWVNTRAYQEALIQHGAMRYNLDGQPVEPISEDNVNYAKATLDALTTTETSD